MEDPLWPIAIYGETDPLCFTSNRGTGPPKECCCWKWKWHIISYNIILHGIIWDYMGYGLIYTYLSLSTHIIPYNFGLRMFSFFFGFGSRVLCRNSRIIVLQLPRMTQLDTESFSGSSPNSMNRQKKVDTALIDRRRWISKHTSSCTDKIPCTDKYARFPISITVTVWFWSISMLVVWKCLEHGMSFFFP